MTRKRVYVESSVISYLTARPSRDIVKLAKQNQTWEWWEQRNRWELFVSPAVLREVRRGDPGAALKRLSIAESLQSLPVTDTMERMADQLVAVKLLPKNARDDALHIAIAVGHGMDYLATWNQAHIYNLECIEKLYSTLRNAGCTPVTLVRPDYLLEKNDEA